MSKLEELRKKIEEKSSREARSSGNPHQNANIDREFSQAGVARKPDDIPKQDTYTRQKTLIPGNVGVFFPSSSRTGNSYRIGPMMRPHIVHDRGHADLPKRDPKLTDYWDLFKWRSMMETAGALRPDLADAIAAYNHFLDGEGEAREFSYERYVMNDQSGRTTLRNAILDAQDAAIKLWRSNGKPSNFQFTGPGIPCGSADPILRKTFPYPVTENWQKAIGAHFIWISGNVAVDQSNAASPVFKMKFVLHAEDQYNFNPGQSDIASGIPDSENGKFVVVNFAHGYRNNSTIKRSFTWKGFEPGISSMGMNIRINERPPK